MTTCPYEKDEIVWAKVKGFPWWPAIVAQIVKDAKGNDQHVVVNFVGECSHATLPPSKVARYTEKYEEYANTKNKRLSGAIQLAQQLQAGMIVEQGNLT
jgi:hypothetical protein